MTQLYENNLQALGKDDLLLTAKLFEIQQNNKYEVFVGDDPINTNLIDTEDMQPIYKGKPLDEIMQSVNKFEEYARYPYLYFFGLGNGILYKLLLSANQNLRRIVVFEPELELIYIALNLIDFSEELSEGRLRIIHSKNYDYQTAMHVFSGQPILFAKVYDLHMENPYYEKYAEEMTEVNQNNVRALEHTVFSFGNDVRDTLIGLKHHVQNLPHIIKTPTLVELLNNMKNSSLAVIASTGPSLSKQLPYLKEVQEHVTIISVDASFPILVKAGIKPDVVASIERGEQTAKFYETVAPEDQEGSIFAVSSVAHERLVNAVKGGTLQMSLRGFGFFKFFELDKWGYIGKGMSAANLCYELAVHAGFKNIVLIGQDLAYGEGGVTHAQEHIFGTDAMKKHKEDFYVEKYGGGGTVRTTRPWKLFLNYFEKDIADMNALGEVTTYNATEGGARINGAVEKPFKDVVAAVSNLDQPKQPIKLTPPTDDEIAANTEKINAKISEVLTYGTEAKERIEAVFLQVAEALEELETLNEQERLEEVDFEKLNHVIQAIEEVKKMFEEPRFKVMFHDMVQAQIMHQELELVRIKVSPTEDENTKKAKMVDWIYAHKFWLFSLAGAIDSILFLIKEEVDKL